MPVNKAGGQEHGPVARNIDAKRPARFIRHDDIEASLGRTTPISTQRRLMRVPMLTSGLTCIRYLFAP